MDMQLAGKVALVAGSSRGIGRATAHAFLAEGSRTVVTGRDGASLAQTQADFEAEFGSDQVMACQVDLSDAQAIEETLDSIRERWGSPDCVVANIGSGRGPAGWDIPESEWERLFDENLSRTYRLIQQVLPAMTERGSGSIVIVASIVGVESTLAPLPYSAAKAALVSYSKNLARHLGPSNIRVNCVAPGNILFPGGSWERHMAERRDEVSQYIDSEVPLRRFGQPEEIADLITFLSSDRSAFITGSCVVADGGQTRSM
jgi:3-oxoacyl-[acyl-carrier protein] reductase